MKSELGGINAFEVKVINNRHQNIDDSAAEFARRWRCAGDALEARRLEDLSSLSERDSARRFANLLRLEGAYPLRPSSGLVEQQRIFDRLRKQT